MKKRIACLGLSYPLMFDSTRSEKSWMAQKNPCTTGHPVIGSGNGLLIMYDEIWFLSKSLCPISMQCYPFVKYLDEMKLPIEYERVIHAVDHSNELGVLLARPVSAMPFTTSQIRKFLNLPESTTGYTEFAKVGINNISFDAGPSVRNYLLDFLIVTELQRLTNNYYELVSNILLRKLSFSMEKKDEYTSI